MCFREILWLSKETNDCDFGWEKNVVKSGSITRIDDMAWEKKFPDGFFY
jgi:hypothetical protein